jgi:putative ABC transport system substrate-binding protein
VVGYLYGGSRESGAARTEAFRKGLGEVGYVEGRNVVVEYRFADNDERDRLPQFAADLVRRRVAVLVASPAPAVSVAKAATTVLPVLFYTGVDPVEAGFVTSFNRPGGNVTGISSMNSELMPKRLGVIDELMPRSARIGLLVSRSFVANRGPLVNNVQAAAAAIGRQIETLGVDDNREIDATFASLTQRQIDALLIYPDSLILNRRAQIVASALHHRVPAVYNDRREAEFGGLMSYGPNAADEYRQLGNYAGRVLKGEKPADLPVVRPTKFEFIINLHTAKLLGLAVPSALLALADEVIE